MDTTAKNDWLFVLYLDAPGTTNGMQNSEDQLKKRKGIVLDYTFMSPFISFNA